MITRGAFIGEIIDELSTIAEQVKLRNTMGYTDFSVFAENFYRDILNVLLNVKLQNLNTDRSNEPGLDLGDRRSRIAFQVTASASTKKVNETLAKLGDDEKAAYDHIFILAIGKSQGSYSIDSHLAKKWKFEPPRVSRRLQHLREWSHDESNEVFPGSAGAGGPDGSGARRRA